MVWPTEIKVKIIIKELVLWCVLYVWWSQRNSEVPFLPSLVLSFELLCSHKQLVSHNRRGQWVANSKMEWTQVWKNFSYQPEKSWTWHSDWTLGKSSSWREWSVTGTGSRGINVRWENKFINIAGYQKERMRLYWSSWQATIVLCFVSIRIVTTSL